MKIIHPDICNAFSIGASFFFAPCSVLDLAAVASESIGFAVDHLREDTEKEQGCELLGFLRPGKIRQWRSTMFFM